MAEEIKDEGQEEQEAGEPTTQRSGSPSGSRIGAARSYLSGAGGYWGSLLRRKWIVILLLVVSSILFFMTIVFGGVWASFIKGLGGERLHQDAARDNRERVTMNNVGDQSDRQLGRATTDRQVPAAYGDQTINYCQFVVPDDLDRRFLREGYTFTQSAIGAPEGSRMEPDVAMLVTFEYLCRRHRRLGISHIVSAYVNMRLDPEQQASRDPQIIRNISAHNRGQAYDLVEIDFVYKVFRFPCPPTSNFTVEYWNDQNQLLLTIPCREPINNTNTTFQGAPATAIPIRILWQDQPSQFALGGLPLNIDSAVRTLAPYLGLSPDALRYVGGSFPDTLNGIGRTYLEELLRLPAGSLTGGDLTTILQNASGIRLADLLGQLPRVSWGANLTDWIRSTGAGWWERSLGLFPGSLQGWDSPVELFRSVGLETAANVLRIPSTLLRDPARARELLRLSDDDRRTLSQDPLGELLLPIIDAIQGGDTGAVERASESYGQQILELTFGAQRNAFRGRCVETDIRSCPDPYAGLARLAERTGIEEGRLRSFVDAILDGGNFTGFFQDQGAPLLENALVLPPGSLTSILAGVQVSFDASAIQSVATSLGVDTRVAEGMLNAFRQGQDLTAVMRQIGSSQLARGFQLSDPLALFEVATGTASQELRRRIESELRSLTVRLDLPPEFGRLERLLSGNANELTSLFRDLGGLQLGDIYGLSVGDIQSLVGGNLSVLTNLPAFRELVSGINIEIGLDMNQITSFLSGNPLLGNLAGIGNVFNGFISGLGVDQALIMERVYRPEARRKVHLVLRELLDMPFTLDNIDLRVTQLITFSHERDVAPFAQDGTLDRVYGRGRSRNFGLFSMPEAFDHIHVGY